MDRFIDQAAVSDSENKDILSFGRKLITLAFIQDRDFLYVVCHFDKSARSVVPRQIFAPINEVERGSLRQCWIKVPQIIQRIPSSFCRTAEYAVVFDCVVDPFDRHVNKTNENQSD